MNNQSKIIINPNVSSKIFLLISIFAFILFTFFFTNIIIDLIKTKDYVKVEAIITKVDYHLKAPDETVEHYIEFNYKYGNNDYTGERRIDTIFNKKVGKKIKIYINPNNPEEIKNSYLNNTIIFMTIMPLIVFLFSLYCYIIKKRNKY